VTALFRIALGSDFERLHPELQRRLDIGSREHRACVGTGVMDRVWRGRRFTAPLLHLGAKRHILFPETGTDIPFTIENYPYLDLYGRETVTFVRTFDIGRGRRRRFDATMVYASSRGRIVDYLGTHQHLAVDLTVRVDEQGGLRITSGEQRLAEGPFAFRFPAGLTGAADLHEWYDEASGRFRIRVRVANARFGPLFGYEGSFTATYPDTRVTPVPGTVRPLRENPRY
jgi:hypothetical protein